MPNDESPARIELIDEIAHFLAMPADAPTDARDDVAAYVREMIIDQPFAPLADLSTADRELLTTACLALSLCPVHLIDYAICFDDEPDACAAVRLIHPAHDS